MQPKSPKLLEDIRAAAVFILQATDEKRLEDYQGDLVLRFAVERNFEIIGEAVKRLAQHDPETAAHIGDTPRIIAFRNVLIHGYDLVDHAEVWRVIREQLPELRKKVEALLREAAGE